MKKIFLCVAFVLSAITNYAQTYYVYTIAGTGFRGYTGDGGQATAADLGVPDGVAIDATGNIYFSDDGNNVIRLINTHGVISTIAGNGTAGFSGDNGPATAAEFNLPTGIALDSSGNIYVTDALNNRIRKINTKGIISTFAGQGPAGFSGDGHAATVARLNAPYGITVDDSGNVYVADAKNNRVRKINSAGIISTVAGNGLFYGSAGDGGPATAAMIYGPTSVAKDKQGNLYIVDAINYTIRKVNTNGVISTIAGTFLYDGYTGDGGPATAARLSPSGVAVDDSDNIYIVDEGNNVIRKINNKGIINTIAGNGNSSFSPGNGEIATTASFALPSKDVLDKKGNVYFGDDDNSLVRKLTTSRTGLISGLNDIKIDANLVTVYPNPSTGTINISSAKSLDDIKVTNVLGQLIYQLQPKQSHFTFELKDEGMYFVAVTSNNETVVQKVVVAR